MTGSRLQAGARRAAVAVALLLGIGVAPAYAGLDEDFATAMISYRRADFATAVPLLRKVADAGHAQAQAVLASILDASDSDEEAIAYYRKAAAAGNLDGIFGLGSMLAAGEGGKKDVKEARVLITRAAEGGHKQAVGALAQAYIRGELEITEEQQKSKEALKWINLAADDGFLIALDALEKAYRTGAYGLAVDPGKADQMKQKILKIKGIKEKKGRRRGDKE